mmetsp:Transcript_29106/g.47057  ORF Transcript_29106/g.47057 Transcript_29106/m.47057 type:complete len:110 (-) Transcript_29106:179-508(-)
MAQATTAGTCAPAPPAPPRPPQEELADMEASDDEKRKMRETTLTMDTRLIILGPGEPPQHADNWTQFRVTIKEKRQHDTWLQSAMRCWDTKLCQAAINFADLVHWEYIV